MPAVTFLQPLPPVRRRWREDLLAGLLGAAFTGMLFLAIAGFERAGPVESPPDFADLRSVMLEAPPPPPPREVPQEPVVVPSALTGIEAMASDSPVQIALTPPDVEALLPVTKAPPAVLQAGTLYADFKPRFEIDVGADHIFQMAEVDQVPKVLNRVDPVVPVSVRKGAAQLRTSMLFVVNAKGEIGNIRIVSSSGNPEYDALIVENIREWTFSPAVRKGRKVRCLLEQAVTVRWRDRSKFEL